MRIWECGMNMEHGKRARNEMRPYFMRCLWSRILKYDFNLPRLDGEGQPFFGASLQTKRNGLFDVG